MKIQVFLNKKGLIHGADSKRIKADVNGTLIIGGTEIVIKANEDCVLPLLFYGASGVYDATFKTKKGEVYTLEKVSVRNGRILPPPSTAVEIANLTCRADTAEIERSRINERIEELSRIFDTNSLNFIIKGDI